MNRILQFLILMVLLIIYLGFVPSGFDRGFKLLILILTLTSIFSHFFIRKEKNKNLKKQYFRISVIFIITFSIVHFQIYIDYILYNLDSTNIFLWINKNVVSKSLIISSLAILTYNLFYDLKPEFKFKKYYNENLKIIKIRGLNILAFIFLILYFTFLDKSYLTGEYNDSTIGGFTLYFSLIFECLINAIIILNCRNIIISQIKIDSFLTYISTIKYTFFLLTIYLLSIMLTGDRGPLIYNGVFVVFSYIYVSKKKLSILNFISLFVIGAIVITILGLARGLKEESNFMARIQQTTDVERISAYYPNSFSPYTKELATSGRCLNMAIESGTRTYGLFALQDLMLLIPTLKGTFISLFDIPKPLTSSAQFLSYYNLGDFATWGVGTSCVADTYLDFGTIGVLVFFGFFGFASRYLEIVSFNRAIPSVFIIVCCFSIVAYSIYIPRATILYSLNKTFYISFFIFLGAILSKTKFSQ